MSPELAGGFFTASVTFYFAKLRQFLKLTSLFDLTKEQLTRLEYQNKEKPFKWKKIEL